MIINKNKMPIRLNINDIVILKEIIGNNPFENFLNVFRGID